ncbi:methylated-DNA--[protein]-cysteine S-methyltransferase [Alteromonas gracilis]|uniref:methylated-DNA--[protein]-cysteine S-methyltransferase n=1 Tax=Alteromonas gracilis TaxID=1479524 RepID=UPI003736ADF3
MIYTGFVNSAQGRVRIDASDNGVTAIKFVEEHSDELPGSGFLVGSGQFNSTVQQAHTNAITNEACSQLQAYFRGTLREFNLPLDPKGTPFQHQVWQALQQVQYGETASYLDIAKAIGNPKAVRAVGMANGRNPIAIVVPCHRIIGSNKTLTGYAGGLPRKQYLLNLEGAQGVLC